MMARCVYAAGCASDIHGRSTRLSREHPRVPVLNREASHNFETSFNELFSINKQPERGNQKGSKKVIGNKFSDFHDILYHRS